jgi:protein-S-isoprenylcysteine O-methyltransferase Ste14
MSHESVPAYGLWSLVILNSLVFIVFAYSFTKPQTAVDWRSFGAFSSFIVALFVEMYGIPLTIYMLSGWLQSRYPSIDLMSHDSGHLWSTVLGSEGNPHLGALHIVSYALIAGGFILLAAAWPVLHSAQRGHRLASTGIYARMRHPQYVGFVAIMAGFLLQWPTILTLAMFPLLVTMYVHLALTEERQAEETFGEQYRLYAEKTPRWLPRFDRVALGT